MNESRVGWGSWGYLLLAGVLGFFAAGKWVIPITVWLAPLLMIRFLRSQKFWVGLLAYFLISYFSVIVNAKGLIPMPGGQFYGFCAIAVLLSYVPFAVDWHLTRTFRGFWGTLIFPCAFVVFEYVNAHGPFGTWGSIAYTQGDHLGLIQLVSLTGIWGLTFLITWFASTVNWMWENSFAWPKIRSGLGIYAFVFLLVLFYGEIRLQLFPPQSETIRVAVLTLPDFQQSVEKQVHALQKQNQSDWNESDKVLDQLLNRVEKESRAGAKLVLWAEVCSVIHSKNYASKLDRIQECAQRNEIYLGASIGVLQPGEGTRVENLLLLISPEGEILWEYQKAKIPIGEPSLAGEEELLFSSTPFGIISGAICYDNDFPDYIQQAGRNQVSLFLNPTGDWYEIKEPHKTMAVYRAVENGFSLIRAANQGISVVTDYHGKVLARADYFKTKDHTLVAQIPTGRTSTLYSRWGDWFAVVSLIVFHLFIFTKIGYRIQKRREAKSEPHTS